MPTETLSTKKSTRKNLLTAIALTLIIALGAFLRLYQLGAYSIGNTYYAATVKSMLVSPSNFFFGAFEPGGSVTVDKPPLGFWVQALSASILGVNGFSLALPNALAGIGSIALLYKLVKDQVSTSAGLVAALTLAVIPVTVSTERNNTIDGLLVFVLLLATWVVLKSVKSGKFRYLLLGAFIVGLGFNIKMLQAYMIIPALYALYFFGAKQGWLTKIWHLGVSTLLLFAVSLSWAITVDLIPAEYRPFIGSSQDNTVLELIIGHNGLSRLGLNDNKKGNGRPQPPAPVDDGQRAQASAPQKPPPNQTPVNVGAAPNQPPQEALDACQSLAVSDACTIELPHRTVKGTCQSFRQSDELVCSPNNHRPAPPDGQVTGNPPKGGRPNGGGAFNTSETGKAGIERLFSEPLVTEASWILPLALISIVLTGVTLVIRGGAGQSPASQEDASLKNKFLNLTLWTFWLLPIMAYFSFTTGLFHRYYLIMLGPALAGLTGLAFWSVSQLFKGNRQLGFGAIIILIIPTLGFQASMLSEYDTATWVLPLAIAGSLIGLAILASEKALAAKNSGGDAHSFALTTILLAMLLAPCTWSIMVTMNKNANVALPTANLNDVLPTSFMTPNNTVMSGNEEAIMNYLLENTDPDTYLLATFNARSAAPYILETGRPVLTFGGFSGGDQVVDAAEVAAMVADGELRYILYSDEINNAHHDISAWVLQSCVPVSVAGVEIREQSPPQNQNQPNIDGLRPPSQNEVLYDCGG